MQCPSCKSSKNKVIDSRITEGGGAIRRRRVCSDCGRRFTTKERAETELRVTVVKRDRTRVPFQREKVIAGVERACHKLSISQEDIAKLGDQVEEDLVKFHDREVSSEQLGTYVGQHLRRLSPVAYVRFMSVYKKYESVDEFVEEIQEVRTRVAQELPDQQELWDG